MNRGEIPGFYYDEEKNKYFKIQANHLVPQDAKYSRENVKRENRQSKKRKLQEKKQHARYRHSVKPSPVLQNSITGGIGLLREHGASPAPQNLHQRDEVLISNWRPARTAIKLFDFDRYDFNPSITVAHYIPETQQMIIASTQGHRLSTALYVHRWNWNLDVWALTPSACFAAFNSNVYTIRTAMYNDTPIVFACSTKDQVMGDLFVAAVPLEYPAVIPDRHFALDLRRLGLIFVGTAVQRQSCELALLFSNRLYIVSADGNFKSHVDFTKGEHDDYTPGVDWLDRNLVAFNGSQDKHQVMLWDVRTSSGVSSRFNLSKKITGVLNPTAGNSSVGATGHQLLISMNHHITLFDTRMPHSESKYDEPILSFSHVHQGPELEFTTNGLGLVAAVDRDNVVQVYSVRSGRHVGFAAWRDWGLKDGENRMFKNLQWYDDKRTGSTLMAGLGNGVVRWTWGGSRNGED